MGAPPDRNELRVRVVLLLPEGDTVTVRAGLPPEDMLDDTDLAAAKWCLGQAAAGRDWGF